MRRQAVVVAATMFIGLLVPSATAAVTLVTCNFVVTESITLGNSLTDCAEDGLIVTEPNVTIALNGFRIDGDGTDSASPPDLGIDNTAGHGRVRIVGPGTISGFSDAVSIIAAARNEVRGVSFVGNTSDGANAQDATDLLIRGNHVTGMVSVGNNGFNVVGASADVTITKNTTTAHRFNGINLSGTVQRATITGNRSHGNEGTGITVNAGAGHLVANNRVTGNGSIGVNLGTSVEDSTVRNNVVSGNDTEGINLSSPDRVRVIENTTNGNGFNGINVGGGDLHVIKWNVASGNESHGINVFGGDGHVVTRNVVNRNGLEDGVDDDSGFGVTVGGGVTNATVKKNKAKGNASDDQCNPTTACN